MQGVGGYKGYEGRMRRGMRRMEEGLNREEEGVEEAS